VPVKEASIVVAVSAPHRKEAFVACKSLQTNQYECVLTFDSLDTESILRSVQRDSCGATVSFIGTTRNRFEGKQVTRLEYQAYSKLAIKTMEAIVKQTIHKQRESRGLDCEFHCALHHRLGIVPVKEASIVVAVSAPHRKEAFVACEEILEQVKAKVQIWKREWYEGEDESEAVWKQNQAT